MAGAGSRQVARRLRAALEDILTEAPPERRPPVYHQLLLLDAGIRRAFKDEADVRATLIPDLQGIGSGPDVMPHAVWSAMNGAEPTPRHEDRTAAGRAGT